MPDQNWQFELEEYIKQGEPDRAEKSEAWQTAIGLQAVDGLNTSAYLLDTAKDHIEGKITIDEAQQRIHSYYEQRTTRTEIENETKEADIVSARIAKLLGEKTFQFSPAEWITIHRRFYETYYKSYIKRIKTNRHQERMRLMLINKYYWNVALLTLLLSGNETLKPFIENDLGITSISTIELKFNFKYFDDVNELLKTFINRINPDHKSKIECNLEDLRNSIFYSALTDENGNILVDENGNKLLAEIGITDTEVFQNLTQAYMPKNEKIIKDIIIQIDDDITVEQLSEGEKKLILVKTVLEILSDEKTLVLMDEPDAHLHEGRKPALCNMMREYPNRQIVIATHSPIMAQIANEKELLMLELENGKSTILTDEKIEKIKKLSGTSWDVIGQGMMLRSSRPLVVFEGKTDVMYVKRALEMLKSRVTDYASLNVDFLNAIAKKIAAELKKAGADDYDLLAVDYFMWDEILPLAEKKSPVSSATPEVKKPVTVKDSKSLHDEIKEKLVAIGELLGFDSRSEVKITTGAVVDAVWEAKIGNMGKAIYVFEVQSKGSIDSLILNLKKAQSNAAVQAVV